MDVTRRIAISPSTTIFESTSRRAQARGAINLGQGFPDFPEPAELLDAAARAVRERSNQYPPMRGLPTLRDAIAAYYRGTQQLTVADEEIVVTSGGTEALAATFLALLEPGDEVILVQPLYDSYLPLVERVGATARLIDLQPPGWTLPLEALEAAISPRTRLIVLNTPHNPSGTAIDMATLEAVGALCERHDLFLLCDEVWEATLLDGAPHVSPLHISSLRERAVKIGSAGKIFALTGWKVGWVVAAPPIAAAIAARHQFLTFTTAPSLQWAVAEGLALPLVWYDAQRARFEAARDRLVAGLGEAGYRVLPARGTWFVTVDLAGSGLPADDLAVADQLIDQAGVAAIPVSAFYVERAETNYLRFCFAKESAVLDTAIERLAVFRRAVA
ncbi:aminotransferase [Sphingomonas sp.]|uniref:aminotransferase n=1 Tax=Sphingomonas sp. TaxID=28214 RepID=UPI0031DC339F